MTGLMRAFNNLLAEIEAWPRNRRAQIRRDLASYLLAAANQLHHYRTDKEEPCLHR
jgi:hypothetical protein